MTRDSQHEKIRALLTIAGTDPCGAAGIQVDLQVFRDFGFHGLCAISAVVAQNTERVRFFEVVSSTVFEAQLDALLEDIPIAGIKIGMLPTRESMYAVARFLERRPAPFVVLDPLRTSGDGKRSLSAGNTGQVLIETLIPMVDIITPNVLEAEALLHRKLESLEDLLLAAEDLRALQCPGVLLKAGHLPGASQAPLIRDVWADEDGAVLLEGLETIADDVRGTGCQLSSAIVCGLASGLSPLEAVEDARRYLNHLLRTRAARPGRGRPIIVRGEER